MLEAIRGRLARNAVWSFILRRPGSCTARIDDRKGSHEHIQFDFLGYTFRPRRAKNRWGKFFVSFLPAISNKAAKAIRETIRTGGWPPPGTTSAGGPGSAGESFGARLGELLRPVLPVEVHSRAQTPEAALVDGHGGSSNGSRRRERASMHWLGRIAQRDPNCSFCGSSGCDRRLEHKSRMRREFHVRFCEGRGVQFPPATRLVILCRRGKGEGAMQRLREMMQKLKLTVNEKKTRICKEPEGELDFLGYTFGRMY